MSKARGAIFLAVVASIISLSGAASATNYIIYVGGDCSTKWINQVEPLYADQFLDPSVVGTYVDPGGITTTNPAPICGYPTNNPVAGCPSNGWVNHDSAIDNTSDPWTSMGELANVLNTHCKIGSGAAHYITGIHYAGTCAEYIGCGTKFGCSCEKFYTVNTPYSIYVPAVPDDTCVLVNHSGSDNIVRLLLATYPVTWNVRAVYTTAGAGGGSELASAMYLYGTIDAGPFLSDTDARTTCGFTWWMDVDTARSGYGLGQWAWDDTSGAPIYHLAGRGVWYGEYIYGWPQYPNGLPAWTWIDTFFPGNNDHGVAFHSSLGRADVGAYDTVNDEGPDGNYYGHYVECSPPSVYGQTCGVMNYDNFVGGDDHFTSKQEFFNEGAAPWFMDNLTSCWAFNVNDTSGCQELANFLNGTTSEAWYDQFLDGLVNGGFCFVGCSGHDYTCNSPPCSGT